MPDPTEFIKQLFKSKFNSSIHNIEALAQSGSYRQYFRIKSNQKDILGVYNTDLQENKAYLSFTKTFWDAGVKVPEIFHVSEKEDSYLIEDLGNVSLWDLAQKDREASGKLSSASMDAYKATLTELLKIQTGTIDKLDLSYCYPRDTFDRQSILWDLNYFKYFFLRLLRVGVDEQKLEDDIQSLASNLDKVDQNYFLYRDFQSRNVMIKDNTPYFIDFQGGRRGALYYDVASLLYDANIELIDEDREELLSFYYEKLNTIIATDRDKFEENFNLFSVIRLTQALGAFGLRGVVEKKPNFKECIPFALASLKKIIKESKLTETYPTLAQSITDAHQSKYIKHTIRGN